MMTVDEILMLARLYAEHEGITLRTVGERAVKNTSVFPNLAEGRGANTRTVARAAEWFSRNWPDDLAWPDDIRRVGQQAA